MILLKSFIQEHLLTIISVGVTILLVYYYLLEKGSARRLSRKYRDSIFEAQSRIFLHATQYLISGNKDMAIKEFMTAVELNRETLETYFALGGLFRSNGEIDKAISIHRALIARENISEASRVEALKQLAIDFDKGGFLDKAIETYKDVLKVNREQEDVIRALCRIFENLGEWEQAYRYRLMLSKVTKENQSETISHILVERAREFFLKENYVECRGYLENAFRFSPSVSAKILSLKLALIQGYKQDAEKELLGLLKETPFYTTFIFSSLESPWEVSGIATKKEGVVQENYYKNLEDLKKFFLQITEPEILRSPAVILSKIRLLRSLGETQQAYKVLKAVMGHRADKNADLLKVEYVKILIEVGEKEEALVQVRDVLQGLNQNFTRYYCQQCGFDSDAVFWRCPQCYNWETINFRWKL
ncbi:MAG: tetratricopeptide repeat protein [Bacteriovoracaceae bacterium]|nr:tetratricopeptide repeat protein [Bacteriovoracaceae bacterium]